MKKVAKYNIYKGVSTLLTIGTPIVTLLSCSELFIHRSDTAISAAGLFTALILLMVFKDKLAERWKTPSAFVLCAIVLVLTILVENILVPFKTICICTMITTGLDEVTFKRFYKSIEASLPSGSDAYKHFGFLCTTTEKLNSSEDNK